MLSPTSLSFYLLATTAITSKALSIPPTTTTHLGDNSTTFSYAALGDSFAAGIAAGLFVPDNANSSVDDRNNVCARMTKSYPYYLKESFPGRVLADFKFAACSGDGLGQIDAQVKALNGSTVDVVSLSVSGNDFGFAEVVKYCVYPFRGMEGAPWNYPKACDERLDLAYARIADSAVWARYREKVKLIQERVLSPATVVAPDPATTALTAPTTPTTPSIPPAVLAAGATGGATVYITGYARFFSPLGRAGDACDGTNFFKICQVLGCGILFPLNMRWTIRQRLNDLVLQVNNRTRAEVVEPLGSGNSSSGGVRFVDIDANFEGRRFCEPGRSIWGELDADVWFHHLFSDLEELGGWAGPAQPGAVWVADGTPSAAGLTLAQVLMGRRGAAATTVAASGKEEDFGLRGFWDTFQQAAVFHPKTYAHEVTAGNLTARIVEDSFSPTRK